MSELIKEVSTFTGYDYKEIVTTGEKVSFLIDSYVNFGWEVDQNVMHGGTDRFHNLNAQVVLRLKRDRKIINKMELTRLQRNFESCIKEIDKLERAKTSQGTMYALIVGILGTICMAGSVFAVTAAEPNIMLCIILAIPGILGWIFPYFIYQRFVAQQSVKMNALIEEKREEVFELCEKGSRLLIKLF